MATRVEDLYDEDFHAWAVDQADALRRLADLRPDTGTEVARQEIADRLIPTLRCHVDHDLPALYVQARRVVAKALAAADALPPANPYRPADQFTDNWYSPGTHDAAVRRDVSKGDH